MENKKELNMGVIQRHVEHLKRLDAAGKLVLCGPFSDYGGGMVILNALSFDEANKISQSDPYILEGYKTYQLRSLEVANKENGYLLA
ncbi:MAG TPA: hypothetical protein GXX75_01365 [Clostridiales bacterium]|nr:hypothetical protein [Clostridiales bacterium]